MLSRFSRVQLSATLWTVAHQAPLPMGFSRQEYWSGLSFPPPGDLIPPRLYLGETGEHGLTGQAGRGAKGVLGTKRPRLESQCKSLLALKPQVISHVCLFESVSSSINHQVCKPKFLPDLTFLGFYSLF